MPQRQIFLSAVTNEFGPLRRRLAAFLQRTKQLHVRHQDDFFHRGVRTLRLLEEEVAASRLVFHVIGAQPGWAVPADQVHELLDRHPEFERQFPDVAADGRRGNISATQWEAWLGHYLGRRVCSFVVGPQADFDPDQQAHLARLRAREIHPIEVADEQTLYDEMIGSLVGLGLLTPQEARRPIWLPYPSMDTLFKGRDDFLKQLRDSLRRTSERQATAITGRAVHGMGGVGKTRLAVEYAWRHAEDYSALLFVTADSPENLRRNLAELAGPLVLDLAEQAATEEEVRVAAAVRWLAAHPGWLLILDNADSETAAGYVAEILPQLQHGHVLITSRLERWDDAIDRLGLEVLLDSDGARYLLDKTLPKSKTGRGRKLAPTDEADALTLARELGGMALALEQAGAYIAHLRKSFTEYLTLWRSHEPKVQEWLDSTIKYAGPSDKPPRSVATTWQTTLDQLGGDERRLLDLLAWFAPEPIPTRLLAGSTLSSQSTESGWDQDRLETALAALADFSMLRWDAAAGTVTVHRVVQEILRTRQAEPHANLTAALRLLNAARPAGDPADVRTWPAWEPLRPHVAFAVLEGKRLEIAVPTSDLMGYLGTLLWAKALHNEAETLECDALAIDEKQFGPDSTEVAARLNNLAGTLWNTNRMAEAEPLMRRALAIDEQSYGGEHPNVAINLNNLAQLLKATNRLAEAEPLMRRALAIDEQSYGAEHPKVAIRLNNLASLHYSLNRLAEAEPLMRRALAIDEQSYGAEHPDVACDLNNLAQLLKATNRLSEAEPLMRRSVQIFEASLGPEHPSTQTVAENLRLLLEEMKKGNES